MKTVLTVKNMVCDRCIKLVREQLQELGYKPASIELGRVEIVGELQKTNYILISEMLSKNGFELMSGVDAEAIEKIKKLILNHLYNGPKKPERMNFSTYLEKKVGMNYFSLSKLFSNTESITIERYIILQKIERVKELLIYDQKSLSEIAFELEYSSVSHLSRQFKSVTGLTPSSFRKLGVEGRRSLDKVCSNNIEVSSPKE